MLTVAFSGVAAADVGDGARTADSVFHTNAENAFEDLKGEALDRAMEQLRHMQLLVIDEVSTRDAPQFEIMCRRTVAVGKVVWCDVHKSCPPQSLCGWGDIGVLLIGDFAQLPPGTANSLLSEAPVHEGKSGRQIFQNFTMIVRFRRVHWQPGADKEPTLRLKNGAMTVEDYELWKTHEVDNWDSDMNPELWPGVDGLVSAALVLVPDNAQAGRLNGKRLSAGEPLLSEPLPKALRKRQRQVMPTTNKSSQGAAPGTTLEKGMHLPATEFANLRTACESHSHDLPVSVH